LFDPAALVAAYTEFLFGDCVPFLKREASVTALPSREELQYTLEGDVEPYRASDRSRWDTPEFYAVFATLICTAGNERVRTALRHLGFSTARKALAWTFDFLPITACTRDLLTARLRNQLTARGGVTQPTVQYTNTQELFEALLEEIGIRHIYVEANPPYVALIDGRVTDRCTADHCARH
jgi:hypothetical protein